MLMGAESNLSDFPTGHNSEIHEDSPTMSTKPAAMNRSLCLSKMGILSSYPTLST